MGCGNHRYPILGDIQPFLQTSPEDGGKPFLEKLPGLMADIQPEMGRTTLLHFRIDGPGDHVPGRQFGPGIVGLHKEFPIPITQHGALPAHRFTDEKALARGGIKGGGVKLDKLHVPDRHTGPVSHGYAIAGCDGWIGGEGIDMSGASG